MSEKTSRSSYTAKFKLVVIKHAEENGNRAASRKFDVPETNVRDWRKQKAKLSVTTRDRRSFRGKKAMYPDVETQLVEFVQEKRSGAFSVTTEMIQIQARRIAERLNIDTTQFRASLGWCIRFLRRHGLSIRRRTTLAQRLPDEYENKIIEFHQYILQVRDKYNFDLYQIGNADQCPVFWDMPMATTIEQKGAKSVPIRSTGYEKQRCTVMLAITADGHKLPPYVVLKRKTLPKEKLPQGVIVRAQEKGWMEEKLVIDWIETVWNRRPGALLKKKHLLVLDSFKAHLTERVKEKLKGMKTVLAVIPGGLTSVLQPLDVSVNKPFKGNFRKLYTQWMCDGEHTYTPSGKLKRPPLTLILEWILKAWNAVKYETVVKSFKKCGISNHLDGREDCALWDNSDSEDSLENEEIPSSSESNDE